jgi:23S rRNA (uracil1939-C5)-methyltransferase
MVTVTIDRLAAGGDGVGRLPDGMAVFVPRTAPGDVADIEVVERRARFARGRIHRLLGEAPERVAPACRHYVDDRCGGCQLQHLALSAQQEAKQALVRDAVRRIARREAAEPELARSTRGWRYRTRVTLAVRHGRVGFHRYDDPRDVFALEDCLIARESLMALWRRVRAVRLPADATGIVLREDRDGGLHVVVEGGGEPWKPDTTATAGLDAPVSWWWRPARGAARIVAGPRTGFPALAFEQSNAEEAARIRLAAVEALGPVAHQVVWDLYGGVGDTARLLAARGAAVWSVDQDRAAVSWGERQPAEAAGSVRFLAGRVEEVLHRLPEPRAVVVNPPRTGLHRRVADHLQAWAARRAGPVCLVYVSCDPATLGRDLARMPALSIGRLRVYDLFPQTAHVEALAVLEAA